MSAAPEALRLGGEDYEVERLFGESFADMSDWFAINPNTEWKVEDGGLLGRWGPGGSVVWLDPVFDGDLLVSCRAETLVPSPADWASWGLEPPEDMPEGGKNLNLLMLCSGPNGENMRECYAPLLAEGTGPNGMGEDRYKGYFFTWTLNWARFRYLPGYECVSELSGDGYEAPKVGVGHHIVALRRGARVRYFLDGRLVHDYVDPDPPGRGQMGFCLWRNLARLSEFTVYRLR